MLKIALIGLQVIIGFYWAGDMARQNRNIDEFVAHLEKGYGRFNDLLKEVKVIDGLMALRKLFGWASVVAAILFVAIPLIVGRSPKFVTLASSAFLASLIVWFSIRWCLEHKKSIAEVAPQVGLAVVSPLLMGIADFFFATKFTIIFTDIILMLQNLFHLPVSQISNQLVLGAIASLGLAMFFGAQYLMAWLFAVPVAITSSIIIALPVITARFIHVITPRRAFVGFTLVLFTFASIGLSLL